MHSIYKLPEGVIYSLIDLAYKHGYWDKSYAFGVIVDEGEEKMFKMNSIPFSDIQIRKETVAFEEEQLELYKSLVTTYPKNIELKEAQNILVRQITDHRKELDLANGFTKLQQA